MVSKLVGRVIITLVLLFMNQAMAQEYSAGINTENPSQYAVLHLVSPNGNQGLLLPRLTTDQRNSLVSALSNSENGLIVYDNDEAQIYYWRNGSWVSLVQSITRSGNTITIENGGSINIGEGTPSIGQGLEWDGANWIPVDPPGIQTLSFSGTNLQILNGNNVDLSPLIDDRDPDPSNEIQTLSKAGNTVALSNGGGSFTDDVNDADNIIGNEFQDLSLSANILSLTNDGTTVDLSGYLDNTDDQTVDQFDLAGSVLNLSLEGDGAPTYTVDLNAFSLPSQAGFAGAYLTTDGAIASWDQLGSLAQLNTITSTEITDASISEIDLTNSIAGNGIVGGAGSQLSIDLAANSGMNFLSNQLQMEEIYPGGITYDGGASTAIRTITFDSKGRFVSASSVTVVLSDKRLKKEITYLDNSLKKVIQLNGYNYYLKSDSLNKELKTGVLAQEVEKVFPNLVLTRPDGFLGVDYQGLIPILLESIKEQQAIIEDLKEGLNQQISINEDQESKITAMEGKLDQLMKLMSVSE